MIARIAFVLALLCAPAAFAQEDDLVGDNVLSLRVDGHARQLLLHVPPGAGPRPLVLGFHGAGGSALGHAEGSRFSELADRENFIVAYPQARGGRWRLWGDAGDVLFAEGIVRDLVARGLADPRAVYASGFSLGAQMTWLLGCERPAMFAAIGMIAGGYPGICGGPDRPPAIIFHGTRDPVFNYRGESSSMALPAFARAWAARDVCDVPEEGAILFQRDDATARSWSCGGRREAVLITLRGKGHTWPGSPQRGRDVSRAVDATEEMWRFFSNHRL